MSEPRNPAYDRLVAGYLEGDLTAAERAELEQLLKSNATVPARFLAELELHESLNIVAREAGAATKSAGAAANTDPTQTKGMRSDGSRDGDSEFVENVLYAHRSGRPLESRVPTGSARAPAVRMAPTRASRSRRMAYAVVLSALAACAVLMAGYIWYDIGGGGSGPIAVAELLNAKGATLQHGAEVAEPVTAARQPVYPNDRIVVGVNGSGRLAYKTEVTALDLAEKTELFVAPDTLAGKSLHLQAGALSAAVAHQPTGQALWIETPNARVQVVGTQFDLQISGGQTRIDMLEGQVNLTDLASKETIAVAAGQFAEVQDGTDLVAQALPAVGSPAATTWEVRGTVGDPAVASDPARVFLQFPDGRIVAGGSQGVFVSDDQGATWFPCATGLQGRSIRALGLTANNEIMAGTVALKGDDGKAGCYRLLAAAATPAAPTKPPLPWQAGNNGDSPGFGAIEGFGLDSQHRVLALSRFSVGLLRSADGVSAYRSITEGNKLEPACMTLFQDPRDGALYVGTATGVMHSSDDGANWNCVFTLNARNPEEGDECSALFVTTDRVLLAGVINARSGLTRILRVPLTAAGLPVDAAAGPERATGVPRKGRLQRLVGLGDGRLFAANSQNGIFASADGGRTWAPTVARLPDPATTGLSLGLDGYLYCGLKDGRICRVKP